MAYKNSGAIYFDNAQPPARSHIYSRNASIKGFAPAFLNLSMLVSAPRAAIAMVSRKVSI